MKKFVAIVLVLLSFGNITAFAATPSDSKASSEAYAYISEFSFPTNGVIDGTAPYDLTGELDENGEVDVRGNDNAFDNKVVRSFDKITYNVNASVISTDKTMAYNTFKVWYELELPYDITVARFSDEAMYKIFANCGGGYWYEYYDKDNNLIAKGGGAPPKAIGTNITYNANNFASGSNEGENSYRTDVARQVVKGYVLSKFATPQAAISLSSTFVIDVMAASNGQKIDTKIKAYVDKNENNEVNGVRQDCNVLDTKELGKTITVSAAPRFDLAIETCGTSFLRYFNLATGEASRTPYDSPDGLVGRANAWGVMISLANETDNPNINVAEKSKKGCELPVGEITCKVSFAEKDSKGKLLGDGYQPVLWDYGNHLRNKVVNTWRTNTDFGTNSTNVTYSLPLSNKSPTAPKWDWQGEHWFNDGSPFIDEKYKITSNAQRQEGSELSFEITLSDYDFDLDQMWFPSCGSAQFPSWTISSELGSFTGAYFQIVSVAPDLKNSTIRTVGEATDLNIHTRTGETGEEVHPLDCSTVGMDANKIKWTKNRYTTNFNVYPSGNAAKSITFRQGYSSYPLYIDSSRNGHISIYKSTGMTLLSKGAVTDDLNVPQSYFILTKWDSDKLKINESRQIVSYTDKTKMDTAYLYVADPLYPGGYNSDLTDDYLVDDKNRKIGGINRMNDAKADDLVYFATMDELKENGYVCIGLMAEYTNPKAESADKAVAQTVNIPMSFTDKVKNGDVGCAVNDVYIWKENVTTSWLDGNNISCNTTLTEFKNRIDLPAYWYKLQNRNQKGEDGVINFYEKGVYENGSIVSGNNDARIAGHDVICADHTTKVTLTADKKIYNLDMEEYVSKMTIASRSNYYSTSDSDDTYDLEKLIDYDITLELDEELNKHGSFIMDSQILSDDKENPTSILTRKRNHEGKFVDVYYTAWYELKDGKYVFHIQDIPVGINAADITFDTYITSHVNGTELKSTANIMGLTEDTSLASGSAHTSECAFRVVLTTATALVKSVDTDCIEVNGTIAYEITFANHTKLPIDNVYLYDILPYNGDDRGSSFDGYYNIADISVKINGQGSSYTTYTSKMDPKQITEQMTDWNNFNKVFTSHDTKDATAVGVLADQIMPLTAFTLRIVLETKDNNVDNVYCNNAFTWESHKAQSSTLRANTVRTETVKRSISGLVWFDENLDGVRQDDEMLLEGVEVELLKLNDFKWEPCYNLDNDLMKTVTGKDGSYLFDKLPEGRYIVVFKGDVIKEYSAVTGWQKGQNSDLNSDGIVSSVDGYDYQICYNDDNDFVSLPIMENLNGSFEANHLDLGVTENQAQLPSSGYGSIITLGIVCIGLLLLGAFIYTSKKKSLLDLTDGKYYI